MSHWNAEHQKGIESTFLLRGEVWGSERRDSPLMRVGMENLGRDVLERGMAANPFFPPLLLRPRTCREKESDNFI